MRPWPQPSQNSTPGIRCTCFDLPSEAQGALNTFRESGVADRCDFLGGDFFVEVPRR